VLLDVTDGLPERSLAPGDVAIEQGVRSDEMFVLVEGDVEVLRDGRVVAVLSEPGSVVGEMSVLLDTPYSATVRARTPARVRVVASGSELLGSNAAVVREVAAILARRLHLVTTYLADLKRQYGDSALGLSMVDDVLSELVSAQGSVSDPGSDREPDPNL